jgi:succinate dehydrogenase/fumarate reductase cytochrome b subunit
VSIVVPEAILFHAMTFVRKLIQDIKAGQLGAGYLGLELVALVVTVVLAISWFWR